MSTKTIVNPESTFKGFLSKNFVAVFMVAVMMFFGFLNKNFYSFNNIINLFSQMCINALLASGLCYVIIIGGIDISVGSTIAVSAVTAAKVCVTFFPTVGDLGALALLIGVSLVIGLLVGAIIGFVVAYINVVPMIATLSFMTVLRGLAYIITGGGSISGLPSSMGILGSKRLIVTESYQRGILPTVVIFTFLVVLLMHLLLTKTVFGRQVFAVGSNARVAHLAGINVKKIKFLCHVLCSVTAALAGAVICSKLQNGQPATGEGYEMYAIASVVLGGTSLSGGSGSVARAMFGVAIIASINNGMNLVGISAYWQKIVIGIIILMGVSFDILQKKRADN